MTEIVTRIFRFGRKNLGLRTDLPLIFLPLPLDLKADQTSLDTLTCKSAPSKPRKGDTALDKADQTSLDTLTTEVGTKANQEDVNTALDLKADQTSLDTLTPKSAPKLTKRREYRFELKRIRPLWTLRPPRCTKANQEDVTPL